MKGVSPLVATVMLIVIVVSLVALISGWLTTMMTDTRETVSNRTGEGVRCTGASVSIESVYITENSTAGVASMIVKNNGIVDELSIISAQIYNSSGYNFTASTALPDTDFVRGAVKTIRFENVSLADCAAFSQAVVATNCGSDRFKAKPTNC
jgi:flagellin-like protein